MFLLKIMLVPLMIGLIGLVGRYYGAAISGLLSGFPIIAGPITYFLFIEQGVDFAVTSSAATISGVCALSTFCFVYAWAATRLRWWQAYLFSLSTYLLLTFFIAQWALAVEFYALLAVATLLVQLHFSPKNVPTIETLPVSNGEIACRMIMAAAVVLLVTYSAEMIGPTYSGIFAAFPIAASVLAIFTHKQHSVVHTLSALKSVKFGLLSLLGFFVCLAMTAKPLGFHVAFSGAMLVAIGLQYLTWQLRKSRRNRILASSPA